MNQEPEQTLLAKKKKWQLPLIIGVAVVVVAAITLVVLNLLNGPKDQQAKNTPPTTVDRTFKIVPGPTAITYAGSQVYDACGLLSFDTIKKNIKNYQSILDTIGTDQRPTEPLTIEHRYIDRDIAQPLGKDGQPRPKGTVIGGNANASIFASTADSNCWYGQGEGISLGSGKTFAKLFITQKPTPISQELTDYLASIPKTASESGFDVYVESTKDSSGFLTGIVTNMSKGIVVISKASTVELAKASVGEIVDTLNAPPKGPMIVTYPSPWASLPNTCTLLTADDFQRFTGQPTGALAEETISLTEVGGNQMQRACQRLEIERLNGTDISQSNVVMRQAKDAEAAKKYSEDLKNNEDDNIAVEPLKQKIAIGDNAYIKVVMAGKKVKGYEFEVRIGAALIMLNVKGETPDASVDAYAERMIPIAQSVADKYRKH